MADIRTPPVSNDDTVGVGHVLADMDGGGEMHATDGMTHAIAARVAQRKATNDALATRRNAEAARARRRIWIHLALSTSFACYAVLAQHLAGAARILGLLLKFGMACVCGWVLMWTSLQHNYKTFLLVTCAPILSLSIFMFYPVIGLVIGLALLWYQARFIYIDEDSPILKGMFIPTILMCYIAPFLAPVTTPEDVNTGPIQETRASIAQISKPDAEKPKTAAPQASAVTDVDPEWDLPRKPPRGIMAVQATQKVQVWPADSRFNRKGRCELSIQHAAGGIHGAFHFTVWLDKDNDGIPDTRYAQSPPCEGELFGSWSSWEFDLPGEPFFVGNGWGKTTKRIYHQRSGRIPTNFGVGDTYFYSGEIDGKPTTRIPHRGTSIRLRLVE